MENPRQLPMDKGSLRINRILVLCVVMALLAASIFLFFSLVSYDLRLTRMRE